MFRHYVRPFESDTIRFDFRECSAGGIARGRRYRRLRVGNPEKPVLVPADVFGLDPVSLSGGDQ